MPHNHQWLCSDLDPAVRCPEQLSLSMPMLTVMTFISYFSFFLSLFLFIYPYLILTINFMPFLLTSYTSCLSVISLSKPFCLFRMPHSHQLCASSRLPFWCSGNIRLHLPLFHLLDWLLQTLFVSALCSTLLDREPLQTVLPLLGILLSSYLKLTSLKKTTFKHNSELLTDF